MRGLCRGALSSLLEKTICDAGVAAVERVFLYGELNITEATRHSHNYARGFRRLVTCG